MLRTASISPFWEYHEELLSICELTLKGLPAVGPRYVQGGESVGHRLRLWIHRKKSQKFLFQTMFLSPSPIHPATHSDTWDGFKEILLQKIPEYSPPNLIFVPNNVLIYPICETAQCWSDVSFKWAVCEWNHERTISSAISPHNVFFCAAVC